MTPPTRYRVSSEGSVFFFFFFILITFTLAYSYNVKHLTCVILCSSGLQNIYIQAPYMEVFNIYNIYIVYKIHIQNRPKVFQWAPIDVWPLFADVDCPVLWLPLLYLHGLNTRAKLYA